MEPICRTTVVPSPHRSTSNNNRVKRTEGHQIQIHLNFFINPVIFVSRKKEQLMNVLQVYCHISFQDIDDMIFCQSGFMYSLESSIVFPCTQSGHVPDMAALFPCLICLFSFLHHSMIRSLQELLDYPGEDIEETFCLNFTVRISSLLMIVAASFIVPVSQNAH